MNKKILIGIIAVVIIVAVVIGIKITTVNNPVDTKIEKEETFYINGNTAKEGMEPLNTKTVLGDILQSVKTNEIKNLEGISDVEANKMFDLEEYAGLEKKVAKYESKNEYTEIWLIKVSKKETQAIEIFRKFEERIQALKETYKQNETISEALNSRENIITKCQNDIAIIVISTKAKEVEKAIDLEF